MTEYLVRNYNSHLVIVILATFLCMLCILGFGILAYKTKDWNRRRILLRFVYSLAAISVLAICFNRIVFYSIFSPYIEKRSREAYLLQNGMQAPPYVLTTLDGKSIKIGPDQTNIVVLDFFATWCGPCKAALPKWQKFMDANRINMPLDFVVVGREQSETELAEFRKTKGYTLDFASDPHRELFDMYFTGGIPRTVVIAPGGRILETDAFPETLSGLIDSLE